MKLNVIPFAALALCSAGAIAQSSVTVYGLLDVGLSRVSGGSSSPAVGAVPAYNGDSLYLMSPGNQSGSRLGFRGTEDLGGGHLAIFTIEMGLTPDTGASDQGGLAFGRQAFVGLKGDAYGTVMLGRQYSPYYDALVVVDPFATGHAPRANNLFPVGPFIRVNNALRWNSPTWSGFAVNAMYALGEQPGETSASRQGSLSLTYSGGPFRAVLGHHRGNTSTVPAATLVPGNDFRSTLLGGVVDLGFMKAHVGIDDNRTSVVATGARLVRSNNYLLGATVPLGTSGTLLATVIRRNDRTAADVDATQYGLGYLHALSKRTNLYSSFAYIDTDPGSGLKVPNPATAALPTAAQVANGADAYKRELTVGIRHLF